MDEHEHPSGMSPHEAWYRYTRYPPLLAKLVFYGLVVAALYVVLGTIESVLFPVLLSLLIAYLLDPTVDWFEERGWSRTTAIGIILLVAFGGFGLFLVFLYPTVAHQITNVSENAPKVLKSVETDLVPWLEANAGVQVPKTWASAMTEYGETVRAQVPTATKFVTGFIGHLWTQVGSVVASAVNLVMIPVFTFYFLRDFDNLKDALVDYLPAANRDFLLSRARKVDEVVGAWFRGQVEVALILAALYATGLATVFGFSGIGIAAGIAIGVLAGLLNIIPYFGFLIGFVLSMLMVILEWNGIAPVLGVLAVFGIVQTLEGYVITPRVVGEKVGLSPVVVIIALLVGGEVLGLIGVLLALPIAGGLRVLLPDVIAYYKASPVYTGEVDTSPRGFVEIALASEAAERETAEREAAERAAEDRAAVERAAAEQDAREREAAERAAEARAAAEAARPTEE